MELNNYRYDVDGTDLPTSVSSFRHDTIENVPSVSIYDTSLMLNCSPEPWNNMCYVNNNEPQNSGGTSYDRDTTKDATNSMLGYDGMVVDEFRADVTFKPTDATVVTTAAAAAAAAAATTTKKTTAKNSESFVNELTYTDLSNSVQCIQRSENVQSVKPTVGSRSMEQQHGNQQQDTLEKALFRETMDTLSRIIDEDLPMFNEQQQFIDPYLPRSDRLIQFAFSAGTSAVPLTDFSAGTAAVPLADSNRNDSASLASSATNTWPLVTAASDNVSFALSTNTEFGRGGTTHRPRRSQRSTQSSRGIESSARCTEQRSGEQQKYFITSPKQPPTELRSYYASQRSRQQSQRPPEQQTRCLPKVRSVDIVSLPFSRANNNMRSMQERTVTSIGNTFDTKPNNNMRSMQERTVTSIGNTFDTKPSMSCGTTRTGNRTESNSSTINISTKSQFIPTLGHGWLVFYPDRHADLQNLNQPLSFGFSRDKQNACNQAAVGSYPHNYHGFQQQQQLQQPFSHDNYSRYFNDKLPSKGSQPVYQSTRIERTNRNHCSAGGPRLQPQNSLDTFDCRVTTNYDNALPQNYREEVRNDPTNLVTHYDNAYNVLPQKFPNYRETVDNDSTKVQTPASVASNRLLFNDNRRTISCGPLSRNSSSSSTLTASEISLPSDEIDKTYVNSPINETLTELLNFPLTTVTSSTMTTTTTMTSMLTSIATSHDRFDANDEIARGTATTTTTTTAVDRIVDDDNQTIWLTACDFDGIDLLPGFSVPVAPIDAGVAKIGNISPVVFTDRVPVSETLGEDKEVCSFDNRSVRVDYPPQSGPSSSVTSNRQVYIIDKSSEDNAKLPHDENLPRLPNSSALDSVPVSYSNDTVKVDSSNSNRTYSGNVMVVPEQLDERSKRCKKSVNTCSNIETSCLYEYYHAIGEMLSAEAVDASDGKNPPRSSSSSSSRSIVVAADDPKSDTVVDFQTTLDQGAELFVTSTNSTTMACIAVAAESTVANTDTELDSNTAALGVVDHRDSRVSVESSTGTKEPSSNLVSIATAPAVQCDRDNSTDESFMLSSFSVLPTASKQHATTKQRNDNSENRVSDDDGRQRRRRGNCSIIDRMPGESSTMGRRRMNDDNDNEDKRDGLHEDKRDGLLSRINDIKVVGGKRKRSFSINGETIRNDHEASYESTTNYCPSRRRRSRRQDEDSSLVDSFNRDEVVSAETNEAHVGNSSGGGDSGSGDGGGGGGGGGGGYCNDGVEGTEATLAAVTNNASTANNSRLDNDHRIKFTDNLSFFSSVSWNRYNTRTAKKRVQQLRQLRRDAASRRHGSSWNRKSSWRSWCKRNVFIGRFFRDKPTSFTLSAVGDHNSSTVQNTSIIVPTILPPVRDTTAAAVSVASADVTEVTDTTTTITATRITAATATPSNNDVTTAGSGFDSKDCRNGKRTGNCTTVASTCVRRNSKRKLQHGYNEYSPRYRRNSCDADHKKRDKNYPTFYRRQIRGRSTDHCDDDHEKRDKNYPTFYRRQICGGSRYNTDHDKSCENDPSSNYEMIGDRNSTTTIELPVGRSVNSPADDPPSKRQSIERQNSSLKSRSQKFSSARTRRIVVDENRDALSLLAEISSKSPPLPSSPSPSSSSSSVSLPKTSSFGVSARRHSVTVVATATESLFVERKIPRRASSHDVFACTTSVESSINASPHLSSPLSLQITKSLPSLLSPFTLPSSASSSESLQRQERSKIAVSDYHYRNRSNDDDNDNEHDHGREARKMANNETLVDEFRRGRSSSVVIATNTGIVGSSRVVASKKSVYWKKIMKDRPPAMIFNNIPGSDVVKDDDALSVLDNNFGSDIVKDDGALSILNNNNNNNNNNTGSDNVAPDRYDPSDVVDSSVASSIERKNHRDTTLTEIDAYVSPKALAHRYRHHESSVVTVTDDRERSSSSHGRIDDHVEVANKERVRVIRQRPREQSFGTSDIVKRPCRRGESLENTIDDVVTDQQDESLDNMDIVKSQSSRCPVGEHTDEKNSDDNEPRLYQPHKSTEIIMDIDEKNNDKHSDYQPHESTEIMDIDTDEKNGDRQSGYRSHESTRESFENTNIERSNEITTAESQCQPDNDSFEDHEHGVEQQFSEVSTTPFEIRPDEHLYRDASEPSSPTKSIASTGSVSVCSGGNAAVSNDSCHQPSYRINRKRRSSACNGATEPTKINDNSQSSNRINRKRRSSTCSSTHSTTSNSNFLTLNNLIRSQATEFNKYLDLNEICDNLYARHVEFLSCKLDKARCQAMSKVLRRDRFRLKQLIVLMLDIVNILVLYVNWEDEQVQRWLRVTEHRRRKGQNAATSISIATDRGGREKVIDDKRNNRRTVNDEQHTAMPPPSSSTSGRRQITASTTVNSFDKIRLQTRYMPGENAPLFSTYKIDDNIPLSTRNRDYDDQIVIAVNRLLATLKAEAVRNPFVSNTNERAIFKSISLEHEYIFPVRSILMPIKLYVRKYLRNCIYAVDSGEERRELNNDPSSSGPVSSLPGGNQEDENSRDSTITTISTKYRRSTTTNDRRLICWRKEFEKFYYTTNYLLIINYKFRLYRLHCKILLCLLSRRGKTNGIGVQKPMTGFELLPAGLCWRRTNQPRYRYVFPSILKEAQQQPQSQHEEQQHGQQDCNNHDTKSTRSRRAKNRETNEMRNDKAKKTYIELIVERTKRFFDHLMNTALQDDYDHCRVGKDTYPQFIARLNRGEFDPVQSEHSDGAEEKMLHSQKTKELVVQLVRLEHSLDVEDAAEIVTERQEQHDDDTRLQHVVVPELVEGQKESCYNEDTRLSTNESSDQVLRLTGEQQRRDYDEKPRRLSHTEASDGSQRHANRSSNEISESLIDAPERYNDQGAIDTENITENILQTSASEESLIDAPERYNDQGAIDTENITENIIQTSASDHVNSPPSRDDGAIDVVIAAHRTESKTLDDYEVNGNNVDNNHGESDVSGEASANEDSDADDDDDVDNDDDDDDDDDGNNGNADDSDDNASTDNHLDDNVNVCSVTKTKKSGSDDRSFLEAMESNTSRPCRETATTPVPLYRSQLDELEKRMHHHMSLINILKNVTPVNDGMHGATSGGAISIEKRTNDRYSNLEKQLLRSFFFNFNVTRQLEIISNVHELDYLFYDLERLYYRSIAAS